MIFNFQFLIFNCTKYLPPMKKFLFAAIATLALFSFKSDNNSGNIYQFKVDDIDGKPVSLSAYQGKVLLIVNVASKCGLTPQYEGLQTFYLDNQSKGFEILGFPANNFMGQEPKGNKDIKEFCSSKYKVTFPMFSKISVKGKDIHPLYKFLTSKEENGVEDAPVSWNFQKFLIGRDGKLIKAFAPGTKVDSEEMTKAIYQALK